jgi:hypothetical protein
MIHLLFRRKTCIISNVQINIILSYYILFLLNSEEKYTFKTTAVDDDVPTV